MMIVLGHQRCIANLAKASWLLVLLVEPALSADADAAYSSISALYLDLRTTYAHVPSGSLAFGFGPASRVDILPFLTSNSNNRPSGVPAAKSLNQDFPLTVNVTEDVSLYAGLSGSATELGGAGWSSFQVSSWNVGFQADLFQQDGSTFPTVTLQSTITQSIPISPVGSTSLNNIVEFDYALDSDETRGFLAGLQYTRTAVSIPLVEIRPNTIAYLGGYYQWPNNWKFTGRVGVQSFEGAQLLSAASTQPFTQPILRFDLDRLDDNDNRLFGVTAEIMWAPKLIYQLTVRTPLYAVRK